MSESKNSIQKEIKDYFQSIKNLDLIPTLSIVSVILSSLFISKIFGIFILNLLYLMNISFFALMIRDTWKDRGENIIPFVAMIISIILSLTIIVDIMKLIDTFNAIGNAFQ
tara:strand:+ start:178 stop:510 length:333 start_codon:yes stop_codon:yes gene_type:complete